MSAGSDETPFCLLLARRFLASPVNRTIAKLILAALLISSGACSGYRETYRQVTFSPRHRKDAVFGATLEFVRVEPDRTVIMIYTSDRRYETRARPGQLLTGEMGQLSHRVTSASPKSQSATIRYLAWTSAPLQ